MIFNRFALIEARERAGLSKSDLANAAGTSRPYITQIERGDRTNPSLAVLRKWAQVCDVNDPRVFYVEPSMDDLLREMNAQRGLVS